MLGHPCHSWVIASDSRCHRVVDVVQERHACSLQKIPCQKWTWSCQYVLLVYCASLVAFRNALFHASNVCTVEPVPVLGEQDRDILA